MAKLPGAQDLGFVAPEAARPVGSFDATPIARGAEQIAQGAQRLGAGISQVGAAAAEVSQDESRWQYAKAHSDFISRKVDLDAAMVKDQNYGPDAAGKDLPARYTEQLTALRANASNMIQDPNMRGLFMTHIAPTFEEGRAQAAAHARSLSNNAQIAYVGEMGDKTIDQAVAAKDDATRTQLIDAHRQLIDGLAASGAVSDVQARQMKQAWAQRYWTADLLARSDTDPQGVINEARAAPGSADAVTNRILAIEGRGKNGASSATGAGQFIDSTWLDVLKRNRPDLAAGRTDQQLLALRADEGLGREMTAAYQRENTAALLKQGLPATPGNIYLAHFLGAGGASAVLKADPDQPVEDALAKALGPAKAKAMVDANPTVLRGQLAGSVTQWADGKMGGAAPGGGSIYDMLAPEVREQILAHAQAALQKQTVQDLTSFKTRIEDSQAEAGRTGNVQNPLQLSDFISNLGAEAGSRAFAAYQANVQVARDVARVATMDPQQMGELIASYEPKPGDGYAAAAERLDLVRKAVAQSMKERADDPAGFAVARLPGTQEAYKSYSSVLGSPTATATERGVAARSFAATTLLEQQGAGIPAASRQILPAADVERFKSAMTDAATSDDPKARVGLVQTIQTQKAMWGDYWPDVVRQLTPTMPPMVRAIAAGADPAAMTRLLALDPKENPRAILREQNETKASDLDKGLNNEFAPFMATLLPVQRDRDGRMYRDLAEKLGALYAKDGKDGFTAARDAFTALVGKNYDFHESYRIPKDAGVAADDVQAGALLARTRLGELGAQPPVDDLPGRSSPQADDMARIARNGVWVTSPGGDGLNLIYGAAPVRGKDRAPLFLSWSQLAQLGGTKEARDAAMRAATEFGPESP